MVAPFKGKRNEYQCPFCGRYASEPNRYCSECFLVNPDQPGKPGSINVLMKPPHSNKPIAMVQLAAAIAVGFLLLTGAFVIWDKYQPGTIPFTFKKDEPAETQPIGEGLPYQNLLPRRGFQTKKLITVSLQYLTRVNWKPQRLKRERRRIIPLQHKTLLQENRQKTHQIKCKARWGQRERRRMVFL